ncbi:aspartate ammonia-lyase [Patescibacteria group bacterium]|nr:aspartate ammonia-lyase [Patescibacteria group bacterium]MCL5797761.1 aspartate ammonia-lyase [Patescibacteria group bacterium]
MNKWRNESDSLGKLKIPTNAYWGIHTQRAITNFPFASVKQHSEYILATVIIKRAAAAINNKLGIISNKKSLAIINACDEILAGKFSDQFVVNPYQAGAGTSHNMNVNEVIANRANQILGAPLGSYRFINPNDDINMSQSTNDVIPSAIRISTLMILPKFFESLKALVESLGEKSKEFSHFIKSGRTHLRDALPITLGQEFKSYAKALDNDRNRILKAEKNLYLIGIGGTAVGTGINSHPQYHKLMVKELTRLTDLDLKSSGNLFESANNTADFLDLSGSLKILAHTLVRVGNDLRLLSSGPRTGLSEIALPPVQAGSSIMPGKINPSVIEMLSMVCFQVIGYDQAILLSSISGQLELNVMLPLIAFDLLDGIKILTRAIEIFDKRCTRNIKANRSMCRYWLETSSGIAAVLNPYIGYDKTAKLVQKSLETGKTVKQLTIESGYISKQLAGEIFNIRNMTGPNIKSQIQTNEKK